jgi:probable blue pigment (indigoidine) exporter
LDFFTGLLFAALWASASVATKFGLKSAQPFMIADTRFFIAGALLLFWAHGVRRHRLPERAEWWPLFVYGALNVSVYLGLFVLAMQEVTPGIGTLSVGTNPLMISVLSALYLGRAIVWRTWVALLLGMIGVAIATWPLIRGAEVTLYGLLLLAMSMLSYSVGAIYFAGRAWSLPRISINAWQVTFGGLQLLPFAWWYYDPARNHFDGYFWGAVFWLVVPVSIAAVNLWLYLLQQDEVKAAMWLFLCPGFGFLYARLFFNEPITIWTVCGTLLVIAGLYLEHQRKKALTNRS